MEHSQSILHKNLNIVSVEIGNKVSKRICCAQYDQSDKKKKKTILIFKDHFPLSVPHRSPSASGFAIKSLLKSWSTLILLHLKFDDSLPEDCLATYFICPFGNLVRALAHPDSDSCRRSYHPATRYGRTVFESHYFLSCHVSYERIIVCVPVLPWVHVFVCPLLRDCIGYDSPDVLTVSIFRSANISKFWTHHKSISFSSQFIIKAVVKFKLVFFFFPPIIHTSTFTSLNDPWT